MASKVAPPTGARPSHTLYCSNLPDKLQKDDLKRALYMLFSVYGSILDIVALKTAKMRGQAHILFRDVSSSTQAMRSLQGFEFFGKEMVCLIITPFLCCSHRANSRIRESHMRRQNLTHLPNSTALTNSLRPPKLLPPLSQTAFSSQSSQVLQAHLLLLDPPLPWLRPLHSTRPPVHLLKLLV
jgi:RNA recognition motif-containing protein